MNDKKYIFIGNRGYVLEEMQKMQLNLTAIAAVKGSWLEKQLTAKGVAFTAIAGKNDLLELIKNTEFDILLSNGCPFIIPVSTLKKPEQLFVNIHPSALPDLRGMDPVPGALLFGRDSGATCHMMDDGIDTGAIIAQKKIPYSADLDAPLLYQLSFLAEKEVFHLAYEREFNVLGKQEKNGTEKYYSKKPEDLRIDFNASGQEIVRRIKAFANKSQGAYFMFEGEILKAFDAVMLDNEFVNNRFAQAPENTVCVIAEDSLLLKKRDGMLYLKRLSGNCSRMTTGLTLS